VAQMLATARTGRLGRIQQVEGNFSHDKFTALDSGKPWPGFSRPKGPSTFKGAS
jgi:hypothetical protein